MSAASRIEGIAGGGRGTSGGGISGRARVNSAAAAKAVAPKKSNAPVKIAKRVTLPGKPVKIDTNPKPVVVPAVPLPRSTAGISGKGATNVNPVYKMSSTAENGIAEARKTLGTTKPDANQVERRLNQDKAREMARIRKQGRNTR